MVNIVSKNIGFLIKKLLYVILSSLRLRYDISCHPQPRKSHVCPTDAPSAIIVVNSFISLISIGQRQTYVSIIICSIYSGTFFNVNCHLQLETDCN